MERLRSLAKNLSSRTAVRLSKTFGGVFNREEAETTHFGSEDGCASLCNALVSITRGHSSRGPWPPVRVLSHFSFDKGGSLSPKETCLLAPEHHFTGLVSGTELSG